MGDSIANHLLLFVHKYVGAQRSGTTPGNRGQCVGLVELWLAEQGAGPVWGNAAEMLTNADSKHYTVTMNAPENYPPFGAAVVWGTGWGLGYGHTAIVLAATVNRLVVFEQNNPTGSPPTVATYGYSGVLGWLAVKP